MKSKSDIVSDIVLAMDSVFCRLVCLFFFLVGLSGKRCPTMSGVRLNHVF